MLVKNQLGVRVPGQFSNLIFSETKRATKRLYSTFPIYFYMQNKHWFFYRLSVPVELRIKQIYIYTSQNFQTQFSQKQIYAISLFLNELWTTLYIRTRKQQLRVTLIVRQRGYRDDKIIKQKVIYLWNNAIYSLVYRYSISW